MTHINRLFPAVLALKKCSVALLCKIFLPKYNEKYSNFFIHHFGIKLVSKAKALKKTNFRDSEKGFSFFTMENKGSMKLIPSQELSLFNIQSIKKDQFSR